MVDVRSDQGDGRCFGTYTTELTGYGEAAEQSLPVWMARTKNAVDAASRGEYQSATEEFLQRFP